MGRGAKLLSYLGVVSPVVADALLPVPMAVPPMPLSPVPIGGLFAPSPGASPMPPPTPDGLGVTPGAAEQPTPVRRGAVSLYTLTTYHAPQSTTRHYQ